DLRWDLACAEGAHLRAEGVELAIVLHCMNEHGARAPPWRQEASCDLSIAGRIACRACCLIRKGGTPGAVRPCPTASQQTGPALVLGGRRASCPTARPPTKPEAPPTTPPPAASCDSTGSRDPLKSGNSPSPWSSRRVPSVSQRGRIRQGSAGYK